MRHYEVHDRLASIHMVNNKANLTCRVKGVNQNSNYTGPKQEVAESSSSARMNSIGFLGQYEDLREEVRSSEKIFIRSFFKALSQMHNTIDTNWVEGCKKRHKELFGVFSAVVQQPDTTELVIETKSGRYYNLDEIEFSPKKFQIRGATAEDEIVDVYLTATEPKSYGCLFRSMLKVALACQLTRESDPDLFNQLKQLAFSLYEVGGLYNETNPDRKEWRKQEEQTLEILTSKPNRKERREVQQAFEKVCKDIMIVRNALKERRGNEIPNHYRYVEEIARALNSTERYCKSPYTVDDYYLSLAADAAQVRELKALGINSSLIKSAFEFDPIRDCEFDKLTGYVSHYNKGDIPDYYPWIITIHIPNPGKFKTRAIHLAISAIQDRCAYIHNRLSAVLNAIPSDCTKHQERGIEFTLQVTNPIWREDRLWPSVLAFDWSNATDRLWSWFQEKALSLVFDKPIVEFWHLVSSCEKEFQFKDGSKIRYQQENGQPQGLLGSFDAFAFAHHLMMLTTMVLSGREEYRASEFYRVLGDDSIITSISTDKENIVGDSYCHVCEWANTPVNRSKSTEIRHDNEVALVEFAKVHALNGEYFSPIPERLANRIGSHNKDYYAFAAAFWGQRHGMNNREWIKTMIHHYYEDDEEIANILMFSGLIPSYAEMGFVDNAILADIRSYQLTLSYWYNKIKATFALNLMSDKSKELLNFDDIELKDSLSQLIPEDLTFVIDQIQDNDHKLMVALQDNLDKEDIIMSFFDISKDQAAILAATAKLTMDEAESIRSVVGMIESIRTNPENLTFYKDTISSLKEKLKPLERLNYRSVYKRDTLNSKIFKSTLETYKELFLSTQIA